MIFPCFSKPQNPDALTSYDILSHHNSAITGFYWSGKCMFTVYFQQFNKKFLKPS